MVNCKRSLGKHIYLTLNMWHLLLLFVFIVPLFHARHFYKNSSNIFENLTIIITIWTLRPVLNVIYIYLCRGDNSFIQRSPQLYTKANILIIQLVCLQHTQQDLFLTESNNYYHKSDHLKRHRLLLSVAKCVFKINHKFTKYHSLDIYCKRQT